MSRRSLRPVAAAAVATLLVSACGSVGADGDADANGMDPGGVSAQDPDDGLGEVDEEEGWRPLLRDASLSYVVTSSGLELVLEVRNDEDDELLTIAAPEWDGTDGLTQTASGLLPWELVLERQPWDEDDLVDAAEVAPGESVGLRIAFDVDCSVEAQGDVTASVDRPTGETYGYRFSEAEELAADDDGTWEQRWQAEVCDA